MTKIISIDPSGTGTTGTCIITIQNRKRTFLFQEFQSKEWQEHLKNLVELVKKEKPNIIVFENTNYIYGRQHQGTVGLYKLIGGIVTLKYVFDFVKEIDYVFVSAVKGLRDRIQTGVEGVEGLSYEIGRGKGWKYQGERVSLHQVDSLVIYHLWSKENYPPKENVEKEITELEAKGKKLGSNQKTRLEKLKRILKSYE